MAKSDPDKKKPVRTKPAKTLAILGRSRRTGRWRLARRSNVLAFCGTVHLDMRKSFADDDKLKMKVTVIFGSATFILPFGAEVRPSGTSILAASMVDVPEHDDPSDLPTIDIEWTAAFGRLRIMTEPPVEIVDPSPPEEVDTGRASTPAEPASLPIEAMAGDPGQVMPGARRPIIEPGAALPSQSAAPVRTMADQAPGLGRRAEDQPERAVPAPGDGAPGAAASAEAETPARTQPAAGTNTAPGEDGTAADPAAEVSVA